MPPWGTGHTLVPRRTFPSFPMKKPPSTRVMEIFSEAAAVADSQRTHFLDRTCDGDSELRAEVESLLNTQERVNDFLSAPTVAEDEPVGLSSGETEALAFVEQDRVVVGRYTIL